MGRWALDVAFVWKAVLTLGLVLLYYCFSIGITFYNKWLTKSFHFPLFMTMLHLAVIFLFSALSRALVQCSSHRARVVLSWADYLRRVAPTALATALDVGLSNWSFLYVTVSLYTMTKSSAVLFILIFSLIFKLEELRAALVLVVLLIAGGLFMFTYKSTQFNVEGFALVLGASFIGGIRWTLTQMLLQKAELGLQNPIDTMFHLQPLMFLGLFPLFAVFEVLLSPAPNKMSYDVRLFCLRGTVTQHFFGASLQKSQNTRPTSSYHRCLLCPVLGPASLCANTPQGLSCGRDGSHSPRWTVLEGP
ncbi:solute carrier family 35 member C2 isoform X5 [Piliocolobus tephrosceles]|uniref:solute carrier family 35 member C2 isoform X5 n=1 Tax=Piliocolobus tephrosceles TaxID=591936 RepID=UPI000C2AB473|nr:solute carrier family 35 member C2 isoform X5 [Piliocolobus tephrosceles]